MLNLLIMVYYIIRVQCFTMFIFFLFSCMHFYKSIIHKYFCKVLWKTTGCTLLLLLSLLSQSLLVFFLCISRAQTMHLERQSLKSIILFIHWGPFWGFVQIPARRSFEWWLCALLPKKWGIQFPDSMYCTVSSQEPQYKSSAQ